MLILRIGRRARWGADRLADNDEHVADAAGDLELAPDEEGLSVFRAEGEDERREVAVRFALTCREKPQHLDFVAFPSELASDLGLAVTHVPLEELDPFLSGRHFEILGLTAATGRRLVATILAYAGRQVGRVRDRDLAALGVALCRRDPMLRTRLRGDWPTRIVPLLNNLKPGT